jgi:hypothetical protein
VKPTKMQSLCLVLKELALLIWAVLSSLTHWTAQIIVLVFFLSLLAALLSRAS